MAMALDESSTLLPTMNAHPLHSIAIEIELAWLPAADDVSCASVFVAVVLLMQSHFQGCPVCFFWVTRRDKRKN